MKRIRLLFLSAIAFAFLAASVSAQSKLVKTPRMLESRPMTPTLETGLNKIHNQAEPPSQGIPPVLNFRNTEQEVTVGRTVYDLQTNYTVCNRLSEDADGNIMATWTMGFSDSDGYSDRGTGYNYFDALSTSWTVSDNNITRLEAEVRTGWPNHVVTESGIEFIVSHVFNAGQYRLHYLRKDTGSDTWIEGDVPTDTPFGSLWPRAAVSGETIHMISVATSTGLGGVVYEGVNLHILYHRSQDGGETWDVVDGIIPGLDSTTMVDVVNADAYAIDARGDVVTVGLFSQWNDVAVFKSTDGGDSWERHVVNDFPLDKYEINQGYTVDQLPPYNPIQPDTFAILTSDNSGNVLIDRNGVVHAWYGEMFISDSDTTDAGWVYWPGTSGLSYWNETFGEDSTRTIADLIDLNGNDTLDYNGGIATYFMSMTTMPSPAVDENNNIYLVYSMVMEGDDFILEEDNQHFRHLFMIYSEDGGETWSFDSEEGPYDIQNEVVLGDPIFVNFVEAVFPSQLRDVTDELKLIYMQDFRPGMSARGDSDPAEENLIQFVRLDLNEFITNTEEVVKPDFFKLKLQPNPATDQVLISFDLEQSTQVRLDLYNLIGQDIANVTQQSLGAGQHQETLNVSDLPKGIYLVRMQADDKVTVRKLVVE